MPATHSCITCAVRGPQSFCSLPALDLLDLDNIGAAHHLEAHQTIKREGYAADHVYLVCKGRIKLCASSEDGRLLLVRIAGPGDVIGLTSVLGGSQYKLTAETLEYCELKSLPRAQFLDFMRNSPDVSQNTALAVAREYEAALLSARRLALSTSAAGKLASALLDWARMNHAHSSEAIEFSMPLTHEELACMAGLSRETVTRLLTRFRSEGLVEQVGERMTLPCPQKLQSLYC